MIRTAHSRHTLMSYYCPRKRHPYFFTIVRRKNCLHDTSRATAVSLIKRTRGYLDNLLNSIGYQGRTSKVKVTWVLCVSRMHDTFRTSWPKFTKCHSLSYDALLLPAEVTGATRGKSRHIWKLQYLVG